MNLAGKSMEGKEYSSAQKYLAAAVKLRPRDPEPHRLLAEVYDATGRQAEAEQERRVQEQLKNSKKAEPN
jgi:uncharacterized protein HemY